MALAPTNLCLYRPKSPPHDNKLLGRFRKNTNAALKPDTKERD